VKGGYGKGYKVEGESSRGVEGEDFEVIVKDGKGIIGGVEAEVAEVADGVLEGSELCL